MADLTDEEELALLAEAAGVEPAATTKRVTPTEAAKRTKAREKYRRLLMQQYPVEQRVSRLLAIAQAGNPIVAMRAMEMIDQLTQMDAEAHEAPALVPIFALPPGTKEPL